VEQILAVTSAPTRPICDTVAWVPCEMAGLNLPITGFGALVFVLGIIAYVIYIRKMLRRNEQPPISTWSLWLMLDAITTATYFADGVFNAQMCIYTLGAIVVCAMLLVKGTWTWTKIDTTTACFVGLAVVGWQAFGSTTLGALFALSGLIIGGWPLVKGLYHGQYHEEPLVGWLIVVTGSGITLLNGELLSGMMMGLFQLVIVTLLVRARRMNRDRQLQLV
jgi:hypothetical protein